MKFEDLPEEIIEQCFPDYKEVEECDEWLFNYTIDGTNYAIYTTSEEDTILNDQVDDLFDELVCEVPEYWRNYIDEIKWKDDYSYTTLYDYINENFSSVEEIYSNLDYVILKEE